MTKFAQELDSVFGTQKTTSIQGVLQESSKGGTALEKGKNAAKTIINRALTPDEDQALDLLEQMVRNAD